MTAKYRNEVTVQKTTKFDIISFYAWKLLLLFINLIALNSVPLSILADHIELMKLNSGGDFMMPLAKVVFLSLISTHSEKYC